MAGASAEWWARFEQYRPKLRHKTGFRRQFTDGAAIIEGERSVIMMNIGQVDFPTGNVVAGDPFVTIEADDPPYAQKVPIGTFPVEVAVLQPDSCRYIASRVKTKPTVAIYWENAVPEGADIPDIGVDEGNQGEEDEAMDASEDDTFFGFGVDSGLACVMDTKTRDFYVAWLKGMHNPYDEFFAERFAENYAANPLHQRPAGDWINIEVPTSGGLRFSINASGWGDGFYPVFMGYDEAGEVCEIVTEFITWNSLAEPDSSDSSDNHTNSTRDDSAAEVDEHNHTEEEEEEDSQDDKTE